MSPEVESSGIVRVPGMASLSQCVAACCDLPGYDLAWLFEGHCYVLSCQQVDNCRPRERPGSDSVLAFLQRASPQTLKLQSLMRGKAYSGRWWPPSRSSEDPGKLEALKDLARFDFPEYSEGSQEGHSLEVETLTAQPSLRGGDSFDQSEASSWGNSSRGDEDETRRTAGPPAERPVSDDG